MDKSRLAWQLAKLIDENTFAEKLHLIVGRLLIFLGILLRFGCHIDFPYHKLHMIVSLDIVAFVLQQAQALLLLVAIAIEAILRHGCSDYAAAAAGLRCGWQLVCCSCEGERAGERERERDFQLQIRISANVA